MILLADEVSVYDNSYDNVDPRLIFQRFIQTEYDIEPEMVFWQTGDEQIDKWVINYIVTPLIDRGIFIQCYQVI
ncbi:MAG: hypothetical protein PHV39_03075 [Methanomicrobium sp.]|nr:hypothetical protein [Methanomicrobium sp.]